jgi:hypothetical protein
VHTSLAAGKAQGPVWNGVRRGRLGLFQWDRSSRGPTVNQILLLSPMTKAIASPLARMAFIISQAVPICLDLFVLRSQNALLIASSKSNSSIQNAALPEANFTPLSR